MAGTGKKKKTKKKKSKAAAEAQPRRSKLTLDERRRVEDMHEILGEVWEPFKTAAGAIRGLEADASPWLELEFWDSLAEAFLRYFGKAITLQVDTAGLLRAQKAAAKSQAAAHSLESTSTNTDTNSNGTDSIPGAAPVSPSQRRKGGGNEVSGGEGGDKDDDDAVVSPVVAPEEVSAAGSIAAAAQAGEEGLLGDADAGQAEAEAEGGAGVQVTRLEMLPMGAVAHLNSKDRLGIIRQTVPKERRMVVLQRLFHLAQAPAVEVELLVASVKQLKDNSSSAEIRDVNLLETWQGVREERDAAWEHATEQVRLAAESAGAESAAAVDLEDGVEGESTGTATRAGDVVVHVAHGGDSGS